MEQGEASAACDGTACELEQPATVVVCGVLEAFELECLERMTLKGELPQRPLLQLVPVVVLLYGQVLETLLEENCLPKVLKDCVYNCRGRAMEVITNVDILRKIFLLSDPFIDSVCGVLYESIVHLHLVQLDPAPLDVLGALRDDFSLVGQEREWDVVYADSKFIRRGDIENCDLPLGLGVLQLERKHTMLRKFFPIEIV